MGDSTRRPLLGTLSAILLGALVTWAGSDGSVAIGSLPVFGIVGALAFVVNWIAFVPANAAKTERYYDLTGSITYLSVTIVALALSGTPDLRAWIVAAMVVVWAARLGTFLFRRVRADGGDGRFDAIKLDPLRFFMTWTIQGLWVLFTGAAALAVLTSEARVDLGWGAWLGIAVWVFGFAVEVVADRQKVALRADPANKGKFITTGLWAWSRHPNYFGEITLWLGIAVIAVPVLEGWRWVALISPVFVWALITRISGVPMLERRADERWGDDPDYQAYKASTPVLFPKPPSRA